MIYIVRHGQTEQNLKKKLQGRSDFPLTELGREQASAVGDAFRDAGIVFDQVYTSPLGRAVETAELIAGDAPIDVEEALVEMDHGPYEGIDLFDLPPEVEEFFKDFTNHPAPDGMEQLSSVVARAGEFLERLKAETVHRHPALDPRHRDEGSPRIPDSGVERRLLVHLHRQLCRLCHRI